MTRLSGFMKELERKRKGKIDIVVGMEYGDEGKGNACLMLAEENKYSFSVRAGSSTAEHRFIYKGKNYRFRVLPSLAARPDIDLFLGAGHIIRKDILDWEINEYDIDPDRITTDPIAAVVNDHSRTLSKAGNSQGRGGYAMGMSQTLCEKMKRKNGDNIVQGQEYWPGKVAEISGLVHEHLLQGQNGLLEGTQGALLSLNHGYYPHTTSYDVNVPALLGQAGLHWEDVREVYGVFRVYPMRVAGKSGIMHGKEMTWDELQEKAGVKIPVERRMQSDEKDGEFIGEERVAELAPVEIQRAMLLNRPTQVVLTHTDWCSQEKTEETIEMIERVGLETLGRRTPVTYLRFSERVKDYRKKQYAR